MRRFSSATTAVFALALIGAGCSGATTEQAVVSLAETPDTVAEQAPLTPVPTSADPTPDTAPATTTVAPSPPTTAGVEATTPAPVEDRPAILRLASLPLYGGGEFDAASVAGENVLLWFWGAH